MYTLTLLPRNPLAAYVARAAFHCEEVLRRSSPSASNWKSHAAAERRTRWIRPIAATFNKLCAFEYTQMAGNRRRGDAERPGEDVFGRKRELRRFCRWRKFWLSPGAQDNRNIA